MAITKPLTLDAICNWETQCYRPDYYVDQLHKVPDEQLQQVHDENDNTLNQHRNDVIWAIHNELRNRGKLTRCVKRVHDWNCGYEGCTKPKYK